MINKIVLHKSYVTVSHLISSLIYIVFYFITVLLQRTLWFITSHSFTLKLYYLTV